MGRERHRFARLGRAARQRFILSQIRGFLCLQHLPRRRRTKEETDCELLSDSSDVPRLTLEELLVLTCKCFLKYFTNDAQDMIDREFVFNTVVAEMHCPLNARSPYTIKKRFKVKMYDEDGKVHWKAQAKEHYSNQILGMYDASLSIEDNLILIQRFYDESKDKHQVSLRTLRKY